MATHGTPPTDAELLARARDDRDAFDELYRRYAPQVRRWFARRTGSEAVALDLTAETFAAAPEMVEPTSYELTLADGRVVTTR